VVDDHKKAMNTPSTHTWFGVSLLLEAERPDPQDSDIFGEEVVILVNAESLEEALESAIKEAKKGETTYTPVKGEPITWKFSCVLGVTELLSDELSSGIEVFARFLNKNEAKVLKRSARLPADL
jgi:hypothetical protein